MRKLLTIGELAKSFNISTSQIRFYERQGLLSPKRIDKNGYRLYDFRQLDILESILLFRDIDISVKEIHNMVNNYNIQDYLKVLAEAEFKLEKELVRIEGKKREISDKIKHVKKYIEMREKIVSLNFPKKKLKIIMDNNLDNLSIKEMYEEIRKYGYKSFDDMKVIYGIIDDEGNTLYAIEDDKENEKLAKLEGIVIESGEYISSIIHVEDYHLIMDKIRYIKRKVIESGYETIGPTIMIEDLSSYSLNTEGSYFNVLLKKK